MMNRAALLTVTTLLSLAPLSVGKGEVDTLRARCAEQERQIRELEEENSKLRSLHGMAPKYAARSSQTTVAAVTAATGPAAAPAPKAAGGSATYTVRKGDSWERVARKFGTQPAKLAALNGTKDTVMLREGQRLKVPAATTDSGTGMAAATPPPAAAAPAAAGTYQVKQGETYYSIGRKFGIPQDTLVAANPTIKATSLRPGLTIRLGQAGSSATTAASSAKPAPAAAATHPADSASPRPATPTVAATQPVAVAPPTAALPAIRSVMINGTTTLGEFAAKHHTTVTRLNDLNNLSLAETTVLAKGSELYVPAQP